MRITSILKSLLVAGAAFVSINSHAQSVKADIATSLSGTYELTYAFATGNSPHKNGDKLTFVINGTDDTLCIGGVQASNPYYRSAGAVEPLWNKPGGNTYYGLSINAGQFNEINVYQGNDGNWVGQFTGTRTSVSTACGGSVGTITPPTVTASVQSIFDLAAELYPSQYKNGGALGTYLGYVYKYFADSKIYVGIKDDKIYTMGGIYGDAIKEQGSVTAVLNLLQTTKTNMAAAAANSSLYKLTLTGTFKTSGLASVTVAIPATVIANLPAPDVSNTTVIVDQVKTSLGATGIANIKVSSINNTAARVTFRVEFSATITGFGSVTYDLTYDYTK